jgi:PAS domain S-box-containing protein
MNLRPRIILAALALVALVNVSSVVYFVEREREAAVQRLGETIQQDLLLLQIVTAGPLYDGNVAQLGATLDSIFANRDVLEIELKETRGDISIARKRAIEFAPGKHIEREVSIARGRDELGKLRLVYSTANIELRLAQSRNAVVWYSMLLTALLCIAIYVLATRLTRPIERLTAAARDIAQGDLQREIDIGASGELAILGQSFVRMRDAVREKLSDLAQKNQQLHEQIEERARVQDALHLSEKRFSTIFREAPVVMTLVRVADGKHVDVNREFEKQSGFGKAEAIGRTALDLGLWKQTEEREGIFRALQEDGSIRDAELDFIRRDGERRLILLNAVTIDLAGEPCWLFITRDITEQRNAEEMRAQLAAVVETSRDAIITRGLDGTIVSWNSAAERMFGWTAEEVIGRNTKVFGPPEVQGNSGNYTLRLERGETVPMYEGVRYSKSGRAIQVEIGISGVYDGEGKLKLVAGIIRDITERKALEMARARLAAIVESSVDAITSRNLDGIVLTWNKSAERMFGYSAAEMVGKHIDLIVPAELREEVAQKRALLVQAGRESSYDTVRLAKDGRLIEVSATTSPIRDTDGTLIGVSALFRNIADRRKAEKALRQSEANISDAYETLNDAIESAPPAIAIYDAEDKLIAFNSRFKSFFAFDESIAHQGADFSTLVRAFTGSGQIAQPQRLHDGWEEERRRRHRDPGEPMELNLTDGRWLQIIETRTHSGGIITVYNDITELKQRQEQLQGMNEALESKVAERTAELATANKELEAFAYSVSHDLRAPLRGIDGFSQVLVTQYADRLDPEARRLLERIRAGAQRMGHLITDLLELSRVARKAVHNTEVDLSALAQNVAGELKAEPAGRAVEWRIEPGMIVHGDRGLLRIALVNLLGNALKYTRDASPARIEFGVARRTVDTIEFCIVDNGAGFDMAYAERLFQPFQRLHATHEFEGTGIGLATVQRVIAKHGGAIRGVGSPGAGAKFYFTLPA